MSNFKRIFQTAILATLLCSSWLRAHEGQGSVYHASHDNGDLRPQQRAYDHNGWNFVASLSATFGGDELIEVEVEDDFFNYRDEEDVRAGESFAFAAGAAYQFYNSPIQLQATVGYHTDGIFADNGDVDFSRVPVELLVFYTIGRHRIGAGVTQHVNPEFDVDIDFLRRGTVEFENATGFVAQYDFRVAPVFAIGVRFVSIEYEPENDLRSPDVEGDHVGLMATFLF